MSVQRIDNDAKRMHGWQARAYIRSLTRQRPVRLTRYFADGSHGGHRNAKRLAIAAEVSLQRQARRLRARELA